MEIDEIVQSVNGLNPDESPKTVVSINLDAYYIDKEPRHIQSHSVLRPEVKLERHFDLVQIDVIFQSDFDVDFKKLWQICEEYGEHMNATADDDNELPIFGLFLLPEDLEGKAYIVAANPKFYCLQPKAPNSTQHMLRFVFDMSDVQFYEAEDVDFTDYKAQAMIKEKSKERLNAKADIKRKEQEERFVRVEELRKKIIEENI